MAEEKRERDEKGRFFKGNKVGQQTIAPRFTHENASDAGKKGGVASGEKRRERKLLKEELYRILNEETTKGSGVTKMESLIQNILNNTLSKGKALDLKILAEILGEMEINVNLNQSEKPKIVFEDGEDE